MKLGQKIDIRLFFHIFFGNNARWKLGDEENPSFYFNARLGRKLGEIDLGQEQNRLREKSPLISISN